MTQTIELEPLEKNPDFQALTPTEQQASRWLVSLLMNALLRDPSMREGLNTQELRETALGILKLHVSGALGRTARETLSSEEMTTFTQGKS